MSDTPSVMPKHAGFGWKTSGPTLVYASICDPSIFVKKETEDLPPVFLPGLYTPSFSTFPKGDNPGLLFLGMCP